ncbi:MAG: L-threonylcarbamoyladenylate synthase [Labrys sp. (in: a-proteobacteria)]
MRTQRLPDDESGWARAAAILADGGLVAFPTETVYGLGADATSGRAVAGIYAAKGRPSFNPLIAHVATLHAAEREGVFDRRARRLANAFWPGPLTLVLPRAPTATVSDLATAGLDSVALRMPAHATARALIAALGRPIAAPSANRSGHVSPTTADHVLADLDGRIDAVIIGASADVGVESTILACLGDRVTLLRPGGVTRAMAEAVIGEAIDDADGEAADRPLAPGRLASHYAPGAPVRLDAEAPRPGEAWLGFGAGGVPDGPLAVNLSPAGDLAEAAANLFACLRRLDAAHPAAIAVAPIPVDGLGEAIRDRLIRAAAPRPPSE